jgi:predicted O-methyltransferase YrrM
MQIKGSLRANVKEEHWFAIKRIGNYPRKYYRRCVDILRGDAPPNNRTHANASYLDASHAAVGQANTQTINFIATTNCRMIAEIGVYMGATSELFAKYLNGEGELHLFDFEAHVDDVQTKLKALGYRNVFVHGNSRKTHDSYNWSLMRVLQKHSEPLYDYVFLDGAHSWNVDALAFLLVDRLLKVGGYIDFDDYYWTIAESGTMNPEVFPAMKEWFTEEQIREAHVRHIVNLLVRRDPRYREVMKNKIYQKIGR